MDINKLYSVVKSLIHLHLAHTTSANSIDPCQPVQSTQTDIGQKFLLFENYLKMKRPLYLLIQMVDSLTHSQKLHFETVPDCVENIVEKGEIAHFEQFHLLPQCFPKAFFSFM